MHMFAAFRYSKWSMRRKLFGYMFLLVALLLLALVAGLLLFGRFDSAGKNAYEALDLQMEVFEKDVFSCFDRLAGAGIQLSEETAEILDAHFARHDMSIRDLDDSPEKIAAVQAALAEPLKQHLLQESCSGTFVILDATANTAQADSEPSHTGLYFQKSSYKTSKKYIYLYRGLSDAGRRVGAIFHNKWRLEIQSDDFPNYGEVAATAGLALEEAYFLTELITMPGTSEKAVLMALPIVGSDGAFYGVCGFEISASHFLTHHAQPTNIPHLTCLLTSDDAGDGVLDTSAALSSGVAGDYYRAPTGSLAVEAADQGLLCFRGDELSYIGLAQPLLLSPNNTPHTLAILMLKSDYDRAVMKTLVQNVVLWLLILFFAISCCFFFSRRYLSPILKGMEQIKSDQRGEAQSPYHEINDLFAFLSDQDRKHEEAITALEEEKHLAQSKKDALELEYERAQLVYEQARSDYIRAQEELASARTERDRLAYCRKKEIDPDDFQHFLDGIKKLTETERNIFGWYLDGMSADDILEKTGIMKSTLKFHNHNILNKLGVSSRKQMLRYATLMKQQEQGGDAQ